VECIQVERIGIYCFAFSYAVALGLELLHLFRPRPVLRLLGLGFGGAGFVAQTIYLAVWRPPLSWQFGWMLLLAWILAVFYLYGSVHHRRLAWGVFVLPLILVLVGWAAASLRPPAEAEWFSPEEKNLWGVLHAALLFLAAVGTCVGFLASLMYLVQARRLRTKKLPGRGLRLLSLERLEAMNRRALILAFPLLTAGMLIGAVLLFQAADQLSGWTDRRVLATGILWLTFALLLYLRYGAHVRGSRVAVLTIVAFALLLGCLALPHLGGQGGWR
jgi:ABC-type transport system involved in cytochrome c biogenesis permease subunit